MDTAGRGPLDASPESRRVRTPDGRRVAFAEYGEVARGLSNRAIAERLFITPKTVGNHVEHIYTKIGVSNRAAAALFAVENGLLPEGEA